MHEHEQGHMKIQTVTVDVHVNSVYTTPLWRLISGKSMVSVWTPLQEVHDNNIIRKYIRILTIQLRINHCLCTSEKLLAHVSCFKNNASSFKITDSCSYANRSPLHTTCSARSGREPKRTSGWWGKLDILPAKETWIFFSQELAH